MLKIKLEKNKNNQANIFFSLSISLLMFFCPHQQRQVISKRASRCKPSYYIKIIFPPNCKKMEQFFSATLHLLENTNKYLQNIRNLYISSFSIKERDSRKTYHGVALQQKCSYPLFSKQLGRNRGLYKMFVNLIIKRS